MISCNDLLIDSLIIDGGRAALGPLDNGAGLLELGGPNQRHTVTNCQLTMTRGWTSLHVIEGYNLVCSGGQSSSHDGSIDPFDRRSLGLTVDRRLQL